MCSCADAAAPATPATPATPAAPAVDADANAYHVLNKIAHLTPSTLRIIILYYVPLLIGASLLYSIYNIQFNVLMLMGLNDTGN